MRSLFKKLISMLLIVACVFINTSAFAESNLTIHFLDVGQGAAAIIQCDGEVMMFDGGSAGNSSFIYSYLQNTLGLEHIDVMVASHPHEDHIGGLSGALNACSVGTIYSPVTEYDSKQFSSLLKYAGKQGLSLTVPSVGDTFTIGSATATFLSPAKAYDNTNDLSLVVRIVYGDTSFLFTGDAEWDAEHDMVDAGIELSSTLLSVGHHGSNTSSSYVFLREVMPEYAVISVGKDNSYGHPSEDTLSRLRDVGALVYRTDLQGTITCNSDGHTLSFETEKNVTADGLDRSMLIASAGPMSTFNHGKQEYVLNTRSKKIHLPDCASVEKMKDKNKAYSNETIEELESQGYSPCGNCHPDTASR